MDPELSPKKPSRRGVAMIVVLSMVVFFTMLGYMGIEMAGKDSQVSGTYLDIASRDVSGRSALQYALARMASNPSRTVSQLQLFVNDSSQPTSNLHQYLNLSQATCSLQVQDPGFLALGTGGDLSAVKVQVLSADLGSDATGSNSGAGIKLTLLVTGRGRNGDITKSVSSYQIRGVDVPTATATTDAPSLDNAIYINGGLPNTNVGNQVTGNVYVAGDILLNGPASMNISGMFRVNGYLTSNAPVTVGGNAVIGGDIYTNGTGPLTFQKNLVVKGGYTTMNANLTVAGNAEIQSTGTTACNWNSSSNLTVGGQYWEKTVCHEFGGKVKISGNAFFDNCLTINSSGLNDTLANVYIARSGGTSSSILKNGNIVVTGNLGSWATGGSFQTQSAAALSVASDLVLKQPLDHGSNGAFSVGSDVQFWSGISNIANSSTSAITTGTTTYLKATGQRGDFNGGLTANGNITMAGTVDANFSNSAGANSRWSINAAAASRAWNYENGSAISTGLSPRVLNASTTNATAYHSTGSQAVPADLFAAPAPVAATAYASNPYSTNDLDLNPSQTWNQVYTVDTTILKTKWVDLTDALVTAAGANQWNWTAADMNLIYNQYKGSNGWLIARIPSTLTMGNINSSATKFTGKAIWIVEKSLNINGNWPGSASSSDIQMIYVRGSGTLSAFGSPSDFYGYIHFECPFTGQMLWGGGTSTVTLTGALHLKGIPTNLTGNGGNTLKVVGSQSVMDALAGAVPGLFKSPSPGSFLSGSTASTGAVGTSSTPIFAPTAGATTGSTRKLVLRTPRLQFFRFGDFR
jgi:cytoskeletal protein CcmA (bactofilin family)/Tfp pilus assembly protein PilX